MQTGWSWKEIIKWKELVSFLLQYVLDLYLRILGGDSSRYLIRLPLYLWMQIFTSCFIALMRIYLSEITIYPLAMVLYLKTNKYNLNINHWKRKMNWWLSLYRTAWKHITESKWQEKYLLVTEMNYVLPGKLFVHVWLFIFT